MLDYRRVQNPLMEYFRHVYHFSERWDGRKDLTGKRVIVYCEQGFGDIIQFLRYLPDLKKRGCRVILHCPKDLHPLLPYCDGVDEWFDKTDPVLPPHDFHVLSLSLPFLLDSETSPKPYVHFEKKAILGDGVKVGVAWEGSPDHPKNTDRCCPLRHFKGLPGTLFMLQKEVHQEELTEGVDFDLFGVPNNDFGDAAALINAVDFVVTVDTSVLHLAGALGKRAFGLLGAEPDPRWEVANWYESVTLVQAKTWEEHFVVLKAYF